MKAVKFLTNSILAISIASPLMAVHADDLNPACVAEAIKSAEYLFRGDENFGGVNESHTDFGTDEDGDPNGTYSLEYTYNEECLGGLQVKVTPSADGKSCKAGEATRVGQLDCG